MMEESGASIMETVEPLKHFQTGKPDICWFENMKQYPLVSQLTKRFLSALRTIASLLRDYFRVLGKSMMTREII